MGEPLSRTTTLTKLLLGPCASDGIQLITPVLVLMVMPDGAVRRLNVRMLAGTSASDAALVMLSVDNSTMVRLEMVARTGGVLGAKVATETLSNTAVLIEPSSCDVTAKPTCTTLGKLF